MAIKRQNYFDEDQDTEPKSDEPKEKATALLPRSIIGGRDIDVGDQIILKVTKVHDDQLAVAYATAPKENEDDSEDDEDSESADISPPSESDDMEGDQDAETADLYA